MAMKNGKPNHGSGKTHFNRVKSKGQSWTKLRDEAVSKGMFRKLISNTNEEK